ncbi:superoxide dismutase family protein [Luteimonas kalidii]|uniref:Superoxide dismutase [Cu-Zn] n=1 Tax=Luteimonas kalidii TaxID=3042025 RepID=A0ABT6JWB1_9GAMM|nr:superoxide dismutase family protein [Luteimonas kalidii]MDH5834980.1 superoxide dismutase family protein [Luteimonas kalidii]
MRHATLLILPAALLLAACQPQSPTDDAATPPVDPAAPAASGTAATGATPAAMPEADQAAMASANATLAPTEGNEVAGRLEFGSVDGGIRITGEVTGLSPGSEHGFHVHETGDCSAPDATSAGGHFNPATTDHGRVGQGEHHAGDSDNIVANDAGTAMVDTLLRGATLDQGETGIIGRGVIVHADPDDYTTQPTGNAGARLACGVIEAQ